jgi:rhodanese-related sulfurtransferase
MRVGRLAQAYSGRATIGGAWRQSAALCTASGVVAGNWPEGLLQDAQGRKPTAVDAALAEELLYEVGWQSRHSIVDVRSIESFSAGCVRGASNVPFEPQETFLERAEATVARIQRDQPPAQHLALASLPLRGTGMAGDESSKLLRLIVGGDDTSSAAFSACHILLQAGYKNAVMLAVGFDEWKRLGLPCDAVESKDDEFPDSTF